MVFAWAIVKSSILPTPGVVLPLRVWVFTADSIEFATTLLFIEVVLPIEVIGPVRFAFVVTVEAVPLKEFAEIIPAEKFPEASRLTIVEGVLAEVAVVALLGIFVSAEPDPLNMLEESIPEDGLKSNFELEDFTDCTPDPAAHSILVDAFVKLSSVMVPFVEVLAVAAFPVVL